MFDNDNEKEMSPNKLALPEVVNESEQDDKWICLL